ncbi:MAG TPA: hypothetical protein VF110_15630 [Burkholderiales bacterium]|jgi:hypothetical protein
MRRIIAVAAVLLVGGCASGYDGSDLAPGASEAEVEKKMGAVAARTKGADGGNVLWFSRQPSGRVIYAARFGKDGKLTGIEQTLTRENLQRIEPGKSRGDDVRAILGPPWRIDEFPRMQREAWTYNAQGMNPAQFIIQFSNDGIVRERFQIDDPEFVRGMAM